jgi:hypothetical protein
MKETKRSKSLYHLLLLVGYGIFLMAGFQVESVLMKRAVDTLSMSPYFYFSIIFPVIFGLLLAAPNLIKHWKNKVDGLTVNWQKMVIFGLPSLLILLLPSYYFTTIGQLFPFATLLHGNEKLHFISGVVFGYIVLNSIETGKSYEADKSHIRSLKG